MNQQGQSNTEIRDDLPSLNEVNLSFKSDQKEFGKSFYRGHKRR